MLCNKFVYTDAVFLNLSLLDVYLPVPGARTLILYDLVVRWSENRTEVSFGAPLLDAASARRHAG